MGLNLIDYPSMSLKGTIENWSGAGVDRDFVIPDPKSGEMMPARLEITEGVWRVILWAMFHMVDGGAGRVLLKEQRVGQPLDTVDLVRDGQSGTLTDPRTGVVVHLTRQK